MAFDFFAQDDDGDLITNPMCNVFQAVTDSSGNFSVDVTNDNLTNVYTAHVSPKATGSAVTNMMVANITTLTTTTVAGTVYEFTSLLGVLGLTAATSKTVYVTVIADQS
jgi:hypothetical protein